MRLLWAVVPLLSACNFGAALDTYCADVSCDGGPGGGSAAGGGTATGGGGSIGGGGGVTGGGGGAVGGGGGVTGGGGGSIGGGGGATGGGGALGGGGGATGGGGSIGGGGGATGGGGGALGGGGGASGGGGGASGGGGGATGGGGGSMVDAGPATCCSDVSAGAQDICATLSDRTVLCYGDTSLGQLGVDWRSIVAQGAANNQYTVGTADHVAIGPTQLCLIDDGGVACQGAGYWGQTFFAGHQPILAIPLSSAAQDLSLGQSSLTSGTFDCALGADQVVRCWGEDGVANWPYDVRNQVTGRTVALSAYGLGCSVLLDAGVYCWGSHQNAVRFDAGSLPPARDVRVGTDLACALTPAGEVWCWGSNVLSPGTGSTNGVPVRVPWFGDAQMLAVGSAHACALRDGGDVTCWGDNTSGAVGGTGPITFTAYATKVVAGKYSSCVLQYDGGVKCWGDRGINVRAGTATTTPYLMPFTP